MNYLDKLKSRKFQLALGAVLISLGSALSGQLDWGQAINAIIAVVLGYNVVEGARDVVSANREG